MKVLVLADARSVHTERYVAELRRQGCEVLLASLEGREQAGGREGSDRPEIEAGSDVRGVRGPTINGGPPGEGDAGPGFVECQDHKGPDLREDKGWTPCQARGDREGRWGDGKSAAATGYVRLRRRFSISTVAYALAAGEVERLIEEWRPDVISAHYASGYGFLASRIRRRGIVLTLHVWGSDVLVVPGKSWLHKMKVVRGIRAADHVFADSRYLAEATVRLAGGAEVSVYPWGIERRYLALHKSEYTMGRPMRILVPRMHEPVYDNEFVVEALREEIEKGAVRVMFPAFGSGYERFCRRVRELGLQVREVGGGGQGQEGSGPGEGCQDHKGPDLREDRAADPGPSTPPRKGLRLGDIHRRFRVAMQHCLPDGSSACQDHKGPDLQKEKGWTPCQARGDREGERGDSNGDSVTPLKQRLLRSARNDGGGDPRKDGGGDPRKEASGSVEGVVYCYRRQSRAEFLGMMAGHDVYLSAAKSDSSPVTLIEAMALGLVAVAADIPGVREWLTDESGFRYQPGDAEGLRKITRRLAEGGYLAGEGDTSYGEMRRRNRERVEREAIFEDNVGAQVKVMERLRGEKRV